MKKIVIGYRLRPLLSKREPDHDEFYEDTWEIEKNEWLPYHKNDVLWTAFSYARYAKIIEEITGFGMKNKLTWPSSANNFFDSLRGEKVIYTYNDKYMR